MKADHQKEMDAVLSHNDNLKKQVKLLEENMAIKERQAPVFEQLCSISRL